MPDKGSAHFWLNRRCLARTKLNDQSLSDPISQCFSAFPATTSQQLHSSPAGRFSSILLMNFMRISVTLSPLRVSWAKRTSTAICTCENRPTNIGEWMNEWPEWQQFVLFFNSIVSNNVSSDLKKQQHENHVYKFYIVVKGLSRSPRLTAQAHWDGPIDSNIHQAGSLYALEFIILLLLYSHFWLVRRFWFIFGNMSCDNGLLQGKSNIYSNMLSFL